MQYGELYIVYHADLIYVIVVLGEYMMIKPVPENIIIPGGCPPPWLSPEQEANAGGLSCVVSVGAVDYNDTPADFSSNGPVTWENTEFSDYAYNEGEMIGLIRPDVCAPGVGVKSLDHDSNNGYNLKTGTSMAAPCVAGIICLMLEKNPEKAMMLAIKGMLPHNRLGRQMSKKLFVYAGAEHPHMAQQPKQMEVK